MNIADKIILKLLNKSILAEDINKNVYIDLADINSVDLTEEEANYCLLLKAIQGSKTNSRGTQLKMMTLEDFMKENNLTAAELARQLDCAKSRICNYLRGETQVTKSFRNLIRAKYNIEII